MPRKSTRLRVGSFEPAPAPEAVHYRVDEEAGRWLQQQAASGNKSHNAVARDCLLQTMSQTGAPGEWRAALNELRHEMKQLRKLILAATHGLLVGAGHLTKDQAAEWVKEKLDRN
jgi:hypothetical protein